jgi:hypothetical protein
MSQSKWWERLYRADAIIGVVSMMASGVFTVITATRDNAPELTSLGWLAVFVALAFLIVFIVGFSGIFYKKYKSDHSTEGSKDNFIPSITINLNGTTRESIVTLNQVVAYIHFDLKKYDIVGSENIRSVADNGVADFSFNFIENLNADTLVVLPIGPMPKFQVLEISSSHVRVKFDNEPDIIKLRFDCLGG